MYIFAPVPGIAVTVAKVPAHLSMELIYAAQRMYEPGGIFGPGISSSPGGGGPGHSPISTDPPLTTEEFGRMITSPPAKRRSRPRREKKCPPGYYWSRTRQRCELDKYHWL